MMNLTITKVDEQLFNGPAKSLNAPGVGGDFTVLPNHSALITLLKKGELKVVDTAGNTWAFPVEKGVLEVRDNQVVVLL